MTDNSSFGCYGSAICHSRAYERCQSCSAFQDCESLVKEFYKENPTEDGVSYFREPFELERIRISALNNKAKKFAEALYKLSGKSIQSLLHDIEKRTNPVSKFEPDFYIPVAILIEAQKHPNVITLDHKRKFFETFYARTMEKRLNKELNDSQIAQDTHDISDALNFLEIFN